MQCCPMLVFLHWIWGFSVISGVLIENLFFLLWSNFINECRITVFSIQEYSSFTGVIRAESVVSSIVIVMAVQM